MPGHWQSLADGKPLYVALLWLRCPDDVTFDGHLRRRTGWGHSFVFNVGPRFSDKIGCSVWLVSWKFNDCLRGKDQNMDHCPFAVRLAHVFISVTATWSVSPNTNTSELHHSLLTVILLIFLISVSISECQLNFEGQSLRSTIMWRP